MAEHEPFELGVESTLDAREKERKEFLRLQYIDDLKTIMQTRQGRRFLHGQLGKAGVLNGGYVDNERAMYFREGARNAGLILLNDMMEADKLAYIKMITEED